mmetsp:Transcript_41391/g.117091  ORF Transcript_41391/g.117091 Transcript_41391/m.117091 type:complete len:203 (-) Transcript_41391:387-995(-)
MEWRRVQNLTMALQSSSRGIIYMGGNCADAHSGRECPFKTNSRRRASTRRGRHLHEQPVEHFVFCPSGREDELRHVPLQPLSVPPLRGQPLLCVDICICGFAHRIASLRDLTLNRFLFAPARLDLLSESLDAPPLVELAPAPQLPLQARQPLFLLSKQPVLLRHLCLQPGPLGQNLSASATDAVVRQSLLHLRRLLHRPRNL